MKGSRLAGSNSTYGREVDDFYATNPQSVRDLLDIYPIESSSFIEPCVGQGHIANVLKEYYPEAKYKFYDLVHRGYKRTRVKDFLTLEDDSKVDWIITNPPYKFAKEFIEKSLSMTNTGVAMFLKLQFLEGQARKDFFKNTPLKYVYVFSARQDDRRDGLELNPKTGKKWGGTVAYAWFIWEHSYKGEPIIRWI